MRVDQIVRKDPKTPLFTVPNASMIGLLRCTLNPSQYSPKHDKYKGNAASAPFWTLEGVCVCVLGAGAYH